MFRPRVPSAFFKILSRALLPLSVLAAPLPALSATCAAAPDQYTIPEMSPTPAPILDGNPSEYPSQPGITFCDDAGKGTADNTAKALLAYGASKYLYISFTVTDTNLQSSDAAKPWLNDAVEVYLDMKRDGGTSLNANDYHFVVSLPKSGTTPILWDAKQDDATWESGFEAAIKVNGTINNTSDTDSGYVVEMRIPWTAIGGVLPAGSYIGIDVAVDDRDNAADGYKYFDWAKLTNFKNPSLWKTGIIGSASSPPAPPPSACETRGAWINPGAFSTAALRDSLMNTVAKGNINTLFLLAPPTPGNRGWSTDTTYRAILDKISAYEAQTGRNISTHVWVANRFRPTSGTADFTSTTEQQRQANWAIALLNLYGRQVDGFHLDYIRYEKNDVSTTSGPYAHLPRVDVPKTQGVTAAVRKIYEAVHNSFPGKKVTASVRAISDRARLSGGPYPTGCSGSACFWTRDLPFGRENQQDVLGWLSSGILDVAIRMNYATNDTYWNFETDEWKRRTGSLFSNHVYMGLPWYDEAGVNYRDAPGVVRKIRYGRLQGLKGFVIFQLGRTTGNDPALVDALTNGSSAPFVTWVPSCL